MVPDLPDSTLVNAMIAPSGVRYEVYRVNDATGEPPKVVVLVSDGITKRDVTQEVLALEQTMRRMEEATAHAVTTVRCLFKSFDDLYPRHRPELPPRPYVDVKRLQRRHGFQQMARVPCYRGARTR